MLFKKIKKILALTEKEGLEFVTELADIMYQQNLKSITIGGLTIERDTNAIPHIKTSTKESTNGTN